MQKANCINDYNLYRNDSLFVNHGDSIKLPDFEAMTTTMPVPGGEVDVACIGKFKENEMEIPILGTSEEIADMINPLKTQNFTIRGALQVTDEEGGISFTKVRIVVSGKCKKFVPGEVKVGETMNGTLTIGVTYYLQEHDGKPIIEVNKMTGLYKVGGVDITEKIRSYC